jgi:phage gpG-like protein
MTSVSADTLRDSAADALDQNQRAADPAIKESKRQAGVLLDQGGYLIDRVSTHTGQTAAVLGKSLIAYTKKNPVTALLLAVGLGALLVSAAKSKQSRR